MKSKAKFILSSLLLFAMLLPVGCSDNSPEPEPPVVPGNVEDSDDPDKPSWGDMEIPLLSEMPTEYTGYENLPCDTMIQGLVAGFGRIIVRPVIEIFDHTSDTPEVPTSDFDDQIFFEYSGNQYRLDDLFPFCFRGKIGHTECPAVGARTYEIPGICLGFVMSDLDEQIKLCWPEKDLTVYIRIYRDGAKVALPPGWHNWEEVPEGVGYASWGGMFVNGVGTRDLGIHLLKDGSVKLVRQDRHIVNYD